MQGDTRCIRTLQLRNLLSFGPDSPPIELGPLNVLIGPNGSGKSNVIEAIDLLRASAPAELLAGARLLVNTTSLGMAGQPPLELALDALPADAVVDDIIYTPLETALLAAARARGNIAVDGLAMLLHQARPGFEAWFGVRPEVSEAQRADLLADIEG